MKNGPAPGELNTNEKGQMPGDIVIRPPYYAGSKM